MQYVEGLIYQESGFINGYLGYQDGKVVEVASGVSPNPEKVIAHGVVLPLFTNYHTHIGDAIARGRQLPSNINELVAPPDGLKFKILRESKPEDLIESMRLAAKEMLNSGTNTFCDFREEGILGVELLSGAVQDLPINPMIMGRPNDNKFDKDKLHELMKLVDGIGVSSISDWDYSELKKITTEVKHNRKLFALHASEQYREDLDRILDLHPDFLVHMTYGTDSDLEKLAELEIPVVICPRSNIFFKKLPNISNMLAKGVILLLGTDNVMINSPNLFDELKAAYKLANKFGEVDPIKLLNMITLNHKKLLNAKYYINLAPETRSNFMVLGLPLNRPERSLVNGISIDDIKMINVDNQVWKISK